MHPLFRATQLGKLSLRNGFIKAATNEGMCVEGRPTDKLISFHRGIAAGGTAMTTVSYGAIAEDGRTFTDQLLWNHDALPGLTKLCEAVHQEGAQASIQITHCGYFTKNPKIKKPIAPSRVFNEYGALSGLMFSKAMDQTDLARVKNDFVNAAQLAKNAGFDAIELHMGHGYLLSQFLSPWTNKRKDEYGGSVQNRARYPLEVFSAVKNALGSDFPVIVKLNMNDGFEGGFDEKDCIYVASELEKAGCDAIELTDGFTSRTAFYLMRGGLPIKGMIENAKNLAEKITLRLFGPFLVKKYAFSENFFFEQALKIRAAVNLPLIYLGGADSLQGIEKIGDAGFNAVALGRPLIHDPAFVRKLAAGEIEKTACNRCNECVVEMDRGGVRCVLTDSH